MVVYTVCSVQGWPFPRTLEIGAETNQHEREADGSNGKGIVIKEGAGHSLNW